MRVHTTNDGAKIKLCDMTDSHLAATIRLMERKAREGIVVRDGGGSGPDDFWYDEDHLHGKDALEHMGYADYIKERDRRISNATGEPRGLPRSAPPSCSDGRCPTCRNRNSRAGERTMDDGSVIVWHCNVLGCSNSEDHPNVKGETQT